VGWATFWANFSQSHVATLCLGSEGFLILLQNGESTNRIWGFKPICAANT
jgi:hypothetical protein